MMQRQGFKIAAASIAILLFVLLLLVPRTPSGTSSDQAPADRAMDADVQEALEMVRGDKPMEGILKLREIADNDPSNIEASWNLGVFSIETGQFDKAIERFEQVLEHDTEEKHLDTYLYLGHAHEQLGNVPEALKNYRRFLESESEPQLMEDVRKRIAELE